VIVFVPAPGLVLAFVFVVVLACVQ